MEQTPQSSGGQNNQKTLSWSVPSTASQQKQLAPAVKKPVSEGFGRGSIASAFIVGFAVGILITSGWNSIKGAPANVSSSAGASNDQIEDTPAGELDTAASQSGGGNVVIENSQPAGLEVSVSKVDVSEATWLVVYENVGGVPGRALGAHLFFPKAVGGATSGTIELLRGTTAGKTYWVGQMLDDGDKKFSMQTDKPVRDMSGAPVLYSFTTE